MKKMIAATALTLLMAGCSATSQQSVSPKPCPCCEKMTHEGMDHSTMDHSKMECCKDGACPHHPQGHEAMSH